MTTPDREHYKRPSEWIALGIRFYAEPALAMAGPLAECLLNRLTAYSFEQRTDGAVDMPALWAVAGNLASVCSIPELLDKLVEHGLLEPTGERTWRITHYLDWQPPAEHYLAKRKSASAKRQRARLTEKARKAQLEQANRLHEAGRHHAAKALTRSSAAEPEEARSGAASQADKSAAPDLGTEAMSPGDTPVDNTGDTPNDPTADIANVTGRLSSPTPTPGVLSCEVASFSPLGRDKRDRDGADHEHDVDLVQKLVGLWRTGSTSHLPERPPGHDELEQVAASAAHLLQSHTYGDVEDVAKAAGHDGVTDLTWWHQQLDPDAAWCACTTRSA